MPLRSTDPPVEHVQAGRWLVVRHHVATVVEPNECKVATGFDLTGLRGAVLGQSKSAGLCLVVCCLAGPLKSLGPCAVAEPVACSKESVSHLQKIP